MVTNLTASSLNESIKKTKWPQQNDSTQYKATALEPQPADTNKRE